MCDVTAAVIAGTAVAGAAASASSKSGGSKSSTQTTNSAPWAVQSNYLQNGFSNAEALYQAGQGMNYDGPYSAAQNGLQKEAAGGLVDYARGTGTDLARGVGSSAQGLLGASQGFTGTAAQMAQQGGGALNGTAQNALTAQAGGQ